MRILFRLRQDLLADIHQDLSRPHPFAAERAGFVTCGAGALPGSGLVLMAAEYHSVADTDYVSDSRVGAMLGPGAFRAILQIAYRRPSAIFHIHRHEHRGKPVPSQVDRRESRRFVPNFWHVCPHHPHGILVLSHDSIAGLVWVPGSRQQKWINEFTLVGERLLQFKNTL